MFCVENRGIEDAFVLVVVVICCTDEVVDGVA